MRNYVIINGVNSLTIQGLAINELPPITKTLMRNNVEEIDGRNGDIVTELGYSAYNKVITIGLFGDYDINDIISFFNQKGTITFSNEDDKVYKFAIYDQIDYESLLKFRTASITLHCQPFKYPLVEAPIVLEPTIKEATDTNIYITDASPIPPKELGVDGNSYQYTTTPTKNIVLSDKEYWESGHYDVTGNKQENAGRIRQKKLNAVQPSTTYYTGVPVIIRTYNQSKTFVRSIGYLGGLETFTTNSNEYYISVSMDGTMGDFKGDTQFICLNSESDKSFVKGYPTSPSPDYPQEVEVVEGYNLWDASKEPSIQRYTTDILSYSNNTLTISRASTGVQGRDYWVIPTEANKQYIISSQDNSNIGIAFSTTIPANDTEANALTYLLTANATSKGYIIIRVLIPSALTSISVVNPQLTEGTTPLPYLPYNNIGIKVRGNQLVGIADGTQTNNGITATISNGEVTLNGTATANAFIQLMTTNTLTWADGQTYTMAGFNSVANNQVSIRVNSSGLNDTLLDTINKVKSFTYSTSTGQYSDRLVLRIGSGTTLTNYKLKPMLLKGEITNPTYEPYKEQITPIDLQDNFIGKIGDVKDQLNIVNGRAILTKRIGKVVLDGSEPSIYWASQSTGNTNLYGFASIDNIPRVAYKSISNYFKNHESSIWDIDVEEMAVAGTGENVIRLRINKEKITQYGSINLWLSTHNTIVYYILAEPYEVDLGQIELPTLNKGVNYIDLLASLESNIKVKYIELDSDKFTINNPGNIYSSPTLKLEGTGIMNVYLDNNQIFRINLTENNEILLDTDLMEAVNPITNELANREVLGDYDKFKLQPGNVELRVDGAIDKVTITNYERWL